MRIFTWINFAFWLIMVACWLISAPRAKRSTRPGSWWLGEAEFRLSALAIALVLFYLRRRGIFAEIPPWLLHQPAATKLFQILFGVIGVVLCAAGVSLAIWARLNLGRNWGMPRTLQEGHALVTAGPYNWVRHPIYAGILLAFFAMVLTTGVIWAAVLLFFAAYVIYSAKAEEKLMLNQFPDSYPAYMKRTKMLIPFVL